MLSQPTPNSTLPPAAPVTATPPSLSAVPVSALPPLAPLPTSDPRSPVAVGQAVFCAVFNLAFSTLTAWLESVPQELIAKVRQSFSSPSPSPSQSEFESYSQSQSPSQSSPRSALRTPHFPERVLLGCRCLYRLLSIHRTFRVAHQRITPRQLGLLGCAARAIERFSGRKFDFSLWRDCGGPRSKPYVWPDEQPAVSPSPSPSQSPSISQSQISNFKSQIPSSKFPPLNLPLSGAAIDSCRLLSSPGSALAEVCRDLARLITGSADVSSAPLTPSPANPLPPPPAIPLPPWTVPVSPTPPPSSPASPCVSVPVRVGPCSSMPSSPSISSLHALFSSLTSPAPTLSTPATLSTTSTPAIPSIPTFSIAPSPLDQLDPPHSSHSPP